MFHIWHWIWSIHGTGERCGQSWEGYCRICYCSGRPAADQGMTSIQYKCKYDRAVFNCNQTNQSHLRHSPCSKPINLEIITCSWCKVLIWKQLWVHHNWFWFYFWLDEKVATFSNNIDSFLIMMPKQFCFGLKPNVKLWESIRFFAVCINFKHLKIYQDFIVMCDQMTSLQWRWVKVKKVTRTLFLCLFICWFRLQNFGRIQCKLTLWLEILSFFKWILWFWWPGDSQSFKFTQPVYTYYVNNWLHLRHFTFVYDLLMWMDIHCKNWYVGSLSSNCHSNS